MRDRDTRNPPNGTLNERLYAMQDPNWNVTTLIEPDGDVVERYLYSAYGDPLVVNAEQRGLRRDGKHRSSSGLYDIPLSSLP